MTLALIDYGIVAVYLLAMVGIGLWIARKVKGFDSFFVAGRTMTTPLLICTLVSTYYGLDVTFGVSEVSFKDGVVAWFVYSRPYYLAILVAGLVLVGRLKAHSFLSLPDVMDHFYGGPARIVSALSSFVYNLPILSIMGMGVVFKITLGLPEAQGYLLGAAIAVLYTLLGGLWADAVTDTIQFAIMSVSIALAVPVALNLVGGFDWMLGHLDAKYFTSTGDVETAYLLALALSSLSVLVEPAFYQRIFAAESERAVRRALLIGILLWAAYNWVVTILGIAAAAAVRQGIFPADLEGREALIHMVLISLPIGLKGFFIAGVLSAAMSTVDSYLLLSGANLAYDIYRPLFRPHLSEASLLKLTRIGIVVALIPCITIALYFRRITDAWVFMSTILTAATLIPIMVALFVPKWCKPWAGTLSSLMGLGSVLLYYALVTGRGRAEADSYFLTIQVFGTPWELWREYSLFFALPASALGFILGGIFTGRRRSSQ